MSQENNKKLLSLNHQFRDALRNNNLDEAKAIFDQINNVCIEAYGKSFIEFFSVEEKEKLKKMFQKNRDGQGDDENAFSAINYDLNENMIDKDLEQNQDQR